MKDEYDFAKGERGKFFRGETTLVPPIHLDPEILSYFSECATAQGTSLNVLVNRLLRKHIELIDGTK
jgi:hypothetical protein